MWLANSAKSQVYKFIISSVVASADSLYSLIIWLSRSELSPED